MILRSGEPLGPTELSLFYPTAQSCSAGLQGEKGVAYAQAGAAAWEPMLQKAQREVQGLGGETQSNAKGQSCCNLHISILRLPPTLLTHMVLIIIFKWKFR